MENPDIYAKTNGMTRRDGNLFSEEFADEIGQMSGRCLDIGSGPGDVAVDFVLPKLNPKTFLVCSDISERMVKFGNERYKDNHRVSFIKLNIEFPMIENLVEQFDHIVSYYCVHWCQDMRQVFGNIFSLLRPGGTALLSFLAEAPVFYTYRNLAANPRYQPYMKDVNRFIPVFQYVEQRVQTLEAILQDAGFSIQHCSLRKREHTFDSFDHLSDFMVAVDPFFERMPADLRKEYRGDLVKAVKERSIILNKENNNQDEYTAQHSYHIFVVYLRKPETN